METAVQQPQQPGRHIGRVGLGDGDPVQDDGQRAVPEEGAPGRGPAEHRGEAEDVGRRHHPAAARHVLGRHEPGRADDHARVRHGAGAEVAGDPEVDDLGALGGEQHVGGLEVPVEHLRVVDRAQRPHQVEPEPAHRGLGQRPCLAHHLFERRSGDVLGGEPRTLGVRVAVEQPRRVPAAHQASGADLPAEAVAEAGLPCHVPADGLDGDEGAVRRTPFVRGEMDLAHAPGSEACEDAVGTDETGRFRTRWHQHAGLPPGGVITRMTAQETVRHKGGTSAPDAPNCRTAQPT
ncbi:hypothetical protein JE024_16540 [Streptomyces zhihengii]|uniref:Uncharacterized protein n=1 Tax=Streptomyces zhihengii TaxID=1818004 RepID=A0ABS2USB5_9ACTN|nr:hypothetical protein [Streptomyces zhihengii]MBM9620318.1 hypothetical protein [Streptomyces zhihengii]